MMFDRFLDGLAFLAGSMVVFMMLGVCLNVIMRYVFNRPIVGMEDITEHLLLFVTFLGTAWVLRKERHVAIDIIVARSSPRTQALCKIISAFLGIVICTTLTWYGLKVTWVDFQSKAYFSSVLQFPKAPIFVVIPIGSALLLIQFIRMAARAIGEIRSNTKGS
jgi:TRAP-type C4-dicarboxylate transport system permease small subunit